MRSRKAFAALLLTALTGCGGGSVSVGVVAFDDDDSSFIFWTGNSNGDLVVDADNQVFAFYADTGCLYNFQTRRENRDFCLTAAGDAAVYGNYIVRIVNVRAATGACVTALVDPVNGRFVDVVIDTFGREAVSTTSLLPEFCFV
ncbi:MAG TPA: hypothetical protein VFF81_11330 [Noviherbaspirillum sp.]|nr:hypothetical protein [Noviherbaspirillum sp.]